MVYIKKALITLSVSEALLPLWKRYTFRAFLLTLVFCTQSYAGEINFDKEVRHFIKNEINSYFTNVSADKYEINLFIPKGSESLHCNNILISRSKKNSPPAGRISITIKCKEPTWRFRASAKVNVWIDLVVAKRNLSRGEVLTSKLLEYKSIDISHHLHTLERNLPQLVGMTVKREITKGDVISRRYLDNKYLVNKDEHILLQVNTSNFSANVKAIALQDGQLGEVINVKNLTSNKVIQGRVVALREVEAIF